MDSHWILNSVPPCNLHWRGVQWCCPSYYQGDNHKLEQTDGWSTTERLMGSSKVERTPPPWPRKGGNHCGHQHYLFLLHDTKQCIPKVRKMMILIRFASKLMAIWLTIRMSSPSEQPTWYPPKSRGTSVISTPSAKFGGADIENMYLETPLDWYENMKMPLKILPDNVIAHYNLIEKAHDHDGHGYMEIWQDIYGLPQAGILANKTPPKNALPGTGISKFRTLQASGSTFHAHYSSTFASLSMTLASNILVMSTCDICSQPFELRPMT